MTNEDQKPVREIDWWENYPLHRIWCNDYCPLVPRFKHREANYYNTDAYSLHWLIFNVWNMDHVSFGIDASIGFDEIYVGVILPYLRIVIGVRHIHNNFVYKMNRLFRRKSKADREIRL